MYAFKIVEAQFTRRKIMSNLNTKLYGAADSLRSKMDASEYKDYLLGLIFYKYLSDNLLLKVVELAEESLEEYDEPMKQVELYKELVSDDAQKEVIENILAGFLGYSIKPDNLFAVIAESTRKNTFQLNDLKAAFQDLAAEHSQFRGLFDVVDLTSRRLGSDDQQRNITISEVVKKLDEINLVGHTGDVIGDAYEFLISRFASEAGKKAGEFYTPQAVSDMMARIVTIGQEDKRLFSVYDPTMGSASLMLNPRKYLNYPNEVKYHGQESNTTTYNLAKMNLILHGVNEEDMNLRNADTLNKDWPTEEPYLFDSVLMNPPYSARWSSDPSFLDDSRFSRYGRLAPKSRADFTFLLHGFYHLKDTGTMAIVLPHGVLFRGAAEEAIRKKLLEDGSIDAVIGLPANLFFGTSIPTTVIILKKNRSTRDVLFIDASQEFERRRNQNALTEENTIKVLETYKERKNIEKYAYLASFEEIKENDFNLNIPRYVDTFEEDPQVDLASIGNEMKGIREKKSALKSNLSDMITDMTYSEEDAEWIQGAIEVLRNE